MVEPINMQILVTNIDEVAKTKNVHEHSIIGQQINAQREEKNEIERKMSTIIAAEHTERKRVDMDKKEKEEQDKRYVLKNKKSKKKEEKIEKAKEPNKGGLLDIEV